MKSNREMRREAWGIVRGRWFWRLLTVGLVLNFIAQAIGGLVLRSFREMGIQTWSDFLVAKAQAIQAGLDFTVPSLRIGLQMTGATLFQTFIAYLFAAIVAFGFTGAALKAAKDDDRGWFAESFGGFRRPLDVTWLMVLANLKVCLWSLLFFIPGLVAAYRYRQAWYVKTEHPDWGASACLRESGRMMKGFKAQAFSFDCSYFGWFFLTLVMMIGSASVATVGAGVSLVGALAGLVSVYLMLFVICYYFAGRAVFYRNLLAETGESHPEP